MDEIAKGIKGAPMVSVPGRVLYANDDPDATFYLDLAPMPEKYIKHAEHKDYLETISKFIKDIRWAKPGEGCMGITWGELYFSSW